MENSDPESLLSEDTGEQSNNDPLNIDISLESASEKDHEDLVALEAQTPKLFSELGLDSGIVEKLKSQGLETAFPVQTVVIPRALQKRDLVVQARTGSGKTIAFCAPLISLLKAHVTTNPKPEPFALVVSPTRELAQQITHVINSLTDQFRPAALIGGESMEAQVKSLRDNPWIIVGTPGRILDLIRRKSCRLQSVRFFVLDEADEMLSMGFLEDVRAILSRLPDKRQGMLLSATITPRVDMLAASFLTKAENVILDLPQTDLPPIEHCYCEVAADIMAKPQVLCDLIEVYRPRSAIIFCNTKSDTQLVEVLLRRRGFDARRLNSDLAQSARNRVMKKIKAGDLQFLVATDVAARGIDINAIDLVVNYSIHEQPEVYVHRTGRTGRAGKTGRAISLVGPRDFGAFHFLTKVLDIRFQKIPVPGDDEVSGARLLHLYEMLRISHIDPKEKDMLLARKLLRELGEFESAPEDFEIVLAKLCRFAVEHHMQIDAKSLDEEESQAEESLPLEQHRERYTERRDSARRDDARGGQSWGGRRDDRRDHSQGERSDRGGRGAQRTRSERSYGGQGEGRGRDQRRESGPRQDDYRGERRPEQRRDGGGEGRALGGRSHPADTDVLDDDNRGNRIDDDAPHSQRSRRGGEGEPRRDWNRDRGRGGQGSTGREGRFGDRARGGERGGRGRREGGGRERSGGREPRVEERELRLYIGQGETQGMTAELFKDLATEFAGIEPGDLKNLSIRGHYGFVDLEEKKARQLIETLNGIEYNGGPLPVELATVIREPRADRDASPQGG